MRNERGVVLPLALMMLMVLGSLTAGVLTLAALEPQISRNLADTNQARFAAEAGMEAAYNQLAGANWNTVLSGANSNGVTLIANATIGTLPAAHGTYTVTVRNDNRATDPPLTGVPQDTGGDTVDFNGRLIVTAVGGKGSATRTLRAVAQRAGLPPIPGAVSLPGNEAETYFNGTSFEIDGRGWKNGLGTQSPSLDASCAPKLGIAVSSVYPLTNPGANEGVVESSLSSSQKNLVKGVHQSDPSSTTSGVNTIAPDDGSFTPDAVKQFIDGLKGKADRTYNSAQPSGLSFSNVSWGTKDNPEIVYIKGEPDPTSSFAALQVSGTSSGYGILIVEDGDFRISGDFTWHGLIIVTGDWVGLGFMGSGTQNIYGAIISNETATDPGYKEGYVAGDANIRYSCEALNMAFGLAQLNFVSYKELAPGE